DGVTYFFYDGLREIEERNGAEAVTQQYVWGHEYIDQLLMIRGAGGTWFVHQDANWNVIALTTPNGDVAEEYQYQPYGLPQVRRHLAFGDSDADGDVDSADNTARTNALSTYNRAFDADFDGDVVNTSGDADQEAWDASYNDSDASVTMVIPNRSFSPSGNPFLFTGRRLDPETGLYFYRFRTYHPTLKQFIQRDPLGYVDSASLYQYVRANPIGFFDPLGYQTRRAYLEKCASLTKKIHNLKQSIERTKKQLEENPKDLPWREPGDESKPSLSQWGHLIKLLVQKAILAALEAEWKSRGCGKDPSNPKGPEVTPEQAWERMKPVPAKPDEVEVPDTPILFIPPGIAPAPAPWWWLPAFIAYPVIEPFHSGRLKFDLLSSMPGEPLPKRPNECP
ncbi:MAG: RHS repeat-associated core domain-containing protein, partial [Chloroflexi bacterium]